MADKKFFNLRDWKGQFLTSHVQAQNVEGGDFLSSESVVVLSGPPKLDTLAGDLARLVPIGLVQNVQVQQSKQINQIFEIGSRLPYFIPGRTFINAGMTRILFDGPSLMYAMYILEGQDSLISIPGYKATFGDDAKDREAPTNPVPPIGDSITPITDVTSLGAEPGYFYSNLASSYFNKPLGLGFVMFDGETQPYGGFYLEETYIQSHSLSIASQQTVMAENVALRVTSLVPLNPADFNVG